MPARKTLIATKEKSSISKPKQRLYELNNLITEAMLMEVGCTPKPGLVDRFNSGSHQDMNYNTFVKSTYSLESTFKKCIFAGFNHGQEISTLFPKLKEIGLEGEKKMFQATGGINTQKGLIFSMAILAAVGGYLIKRDLLLEREKFIPLIKDLTGGLVARNFSGVTKKSESDLTAGEKAFIEYNITGIRGEVEAGFPSVFNISLPILNKFIKNGFGFNDSLLASLLALMTKVNDTTIISRGGLDSLKWMHDYSSEIFKKYTSDECEERTDLLIQMNRVFVDKNLSPGGCADLLAVTVLFYMLENQNI